MDHHDADNYNRWAHERNRRDGEGQIALAFMGIISWGISLLVYTYTDKYWHFIGKYAFFLGLIFGVLLWLSKMGNSDNRNRRSPHNPNNHH